MPDFLLHLDRQLFYLINNGLSNPFFDVVMPWMRNARSWIPLYVLIVGFCLWRYKKQGLIIIMIAALAVGFADYSSASIVKMLVKRTRPCREIAIHSTEISRVPCGTGYSFPSTHATDHFALAVFFSLVFYKRWHWIWLWAILWAGLICFAQVYVGVHYPVDVTVGALYGSLIAWCFWLWYKKLTATRVAANSKSEEN